MLTQADEIVRQLNSIVKESMDMRGKLEGLFDKFIERRDETYSCGEFGEYTDMCEYCRGKRQAWDTAAFFLARMVDETFKDTES